LDRNSFRRLIASLVVLSVGCADSAPQPSGSASMSMRPAFLGKPAKAKSAKVGSASIFFSFYDPSAVNDSGLISFAIVAPDEVRQLEDAFSGLRDGSRMDGSMLFMSTSEVEFRYDDGSIERISHDFNFWRDSEGRCSSVSQDATRIIAESSKQLNENARRQVMWFIEQSAMVRNAK